MPFKRFLFASRIGLSEEDLSSGISFLSDAVAVLSLWITNTGLSSFVQLLFVFFEVSPPIDLLLLPLIWAFHERDRFLLCVSPPLIRLFPFPHFLSPA